MSPRRNASEMVLTSCSNLSVSWLRPLRLPEFHAHALHPELREVAVPYQGTPEAPTLNILPSHDLSAKTTLKMSLHGLSSRSTDMDDFMSSVPGA